MTTRTLPALLVGASLFALTLPASAEDITFWSWRQEDRAAYEQFIAAFEAAHPDINVTFEAFEAQNYATILSTALAGGEGPDVMMVRAYGAFEALATPGYLTALDPSVVTELANFPESALKAETLRSDGKVYAVPFATQTMLILYNKALFDANGLAEPETWDQLVDACRKLQEAGLICFANGTATAWQNETLTFSLLSSLIGRSFVDDVRAGNATFEDPRFVSALGKLNDIKDIAFAPGFIGLDYASSQQLFTAGRAAMFAGGSFEIANFRAQNPDLELGVFAPPPATAGDERLVATYYDGGYAVNAASPHQEAALAFVRYLGSKEYADAFANTLGNISPVEGVAFRDPLLAEVAELDKSAIPYLMLVDFRYQEPTGSVLLQQNVQKMLAGEATPEEAGRAVTEGIATYYAPFQKQ